MGHDRVGTLPRTRRWAQIGELLSTSAQSSGNDLPTKEIASLTIQAAKSKLRQAQADPAVNRAFQFLVLLSVASQKDDPRTFLSHHGVDVSQHATPLALSIALRSWLAST